MFIITNFIRPIKGFYWGMTTHIETGCDSLRLAITRCLIVTLTKVRSLFLNFNNINISQFTIIPLRLRGSSTSGALPPPSRPGPTLTKPLMFLFLFIKTLHTQIYLNPLSLYPYALISLSLSLRHAHYTQSLSFSQFVCILGSLFFNITSWHLSKYFVLGSS